MIKHVVVRRKKPKATWYSDSIQHHTELAHELKNLSQWLCIYLYWCTCVWIGTRPMCCLISHVPLKNWKKNLIWYYLHMWLLLHPKCYTATRSHQPKDDRSDTCYCCWRWGLSHGGGECFWHWSQEEDRWQGKCVIPLSLYHQAKSLYPSTTSQNPSIPLPSLHHSTTVNQNPTIPPLLI